MKIAIFNEDIGNSDLDMTDPKKGNPGIGGLDFSLWATPYYLIQKYPDIQIMMFLLEKRRYPEEFCVTVVQNVFEAARAAKQGGADFLIIRNCQGNNVYQYLNRIHMDTILIAGNFSTPTELDALAGNRHIVAYVCVGKQQYGMLYDEKIFHKATYIYNSFDCSLYKALGQKKENIVAFLGGVYPVKGLHILAKAWKQIKKRVPDAKLYIIGSAKLYNKKNKLGKYGLAQADYEKTFIQYLLDDKKRIQKDVYLLGTLGGEEKLAIMDKVKVGVMNPSATTETFGYSAVEFEALGVPVVTKAKNGLFDTVKHGRTGLLFHTQKGLVEYVVKLLTDETLNKKLGNNGIQFVRTTFDINDIVDEWYKLFLNLKHKKAIGKRLYIKDFLHNYIWLRGINAFMKQKFVWWKLPSLNKMINKFQ